MRHIYSLTDQTCKVFTGNAVRIAEEADVAEQYIYAILAGAQTDPFAPFEHYYKAAVRAGAPVWHWRARLDAIDARYAKMLPAKTPMACLSDKIESDTKTTLATIAALNDGVIDAHEAEKLQGLVNRERKALDALEKALQMHAREQRKTSAGQKVLQRFPPMNGRAR